MILLLTFFLWLKVLTQVVFNSIMQLSVLRRGVRRVPSWIGILRDAAKAKEKSLSYDIKIFDEVSWRRKKFSFSQDSWNPAQMSNIVKKKLCLGDEGREYTIIGEAFPFPDKEDCPVVNVPSKLCTLLWDHNSEGDKIMVQLSNDFPPLLWHTIKPTYEAISRIFSEFVDIDAQHMKDHLPYYESVQNGVERMLTERVTESIGLSYMKNKFIEDMRKRDPQTISMDYHLEHNVYLGTSPHFRLVEERFMKTNPFVFGWPLLLSDGNDHMEDTPLRMAAFRTIFSKSLLLFHTRLDLQVDHRQTYLRPDDKIEDVLLDIPLFCTINYPINNRLCGGRPLVQRFNQVMGMSFPTDTPVDILATFAMERVTKGEKEVLTEMNFLAKAANKAPDVERVFRLSENQISSNRIIGQLAYTIIYLALLNYRDFEKEVFHFFKRHTSDLIRVACAKGALLLDRLDLVHQLIQWEPEGRVKLMLESSLSMRRKPTTSSSEAVM